MIALIGIPCIRQYLRSITGGVPQTPKHPPRKSSGCDDLRSRGSGVGPWRCITSGGRRSECVSNYIIGTRSIVARVQQFFSVQSQAALATNSQRRLHHSNTEVADKQCAGLQTQVNVGALPTLRVGGKSFMNQKDRKEHFASFDQTVWMGEKSR